MAVWGAKKSRKDCKRCRQLQSPEAFEDGAQVRIAGVGDCKNCEVMKNQPIRENQNIVDLYNALPQEGGVAVKDVHALFEIYELPQELWFDYYQRLLFLHNTMVDAKDKEYKKGMGEKKMVDQWKAKRFSVGKRRLGKVH